MSENPHCAVVAQTIRDECWDADFETFDVDKAARIIEAELRAECDLFSRIAERLETEKIILKTQLEQAQGMLNKALGKLSLL